MILLSTCTCWNVSPCRIPAPSLSNALASECETSLTDATRPGQHKHSIETGLLRPNHTSDQEGICARGEVIVLDGTKGPVKADGQDLPTTDLDRMFRFDCSVMAGGVLFVDPLGLLGCSILGAPVPGHEQAGGPDIWV